MLTERKNLGVVLYVYYTCVCVRACIYSYMGLLTHTHTGIDRTVVSSNIGAVPRVPLLHPVANLPKTYTVVLN